MTKVVAIGLDGLELSQAERLMAEGKMPALPALRERGMTSSGGPSGSAVRPACGPAPSAGPR